MTCRDWRGLSAAVTEPLYAAEIHRAETLLHADTRAVWHQVERARRAGTLPGFVAEDHAGVTGWTFQLLHRGCLQVGAVVADSAAGTRLLLDHVLSSAEGRAASSTLVFAPAAAPGLVTDLQSREFVVERYWHMERSLDGLRDEPEPGREWNARDAHPVAGLMARAYESGQPARPFAREGDAAAWLDYVRQLTTTTGCGVFAPKLSIVVEGRKRDTVAAAVVTTSVGPGTGHLAQVVVDPDAQGVGLGRRAVRSAMDKLRHAGFARVTLLVGEQNRTARGLYRTLGFVDTAEFVSAAVDQPRRLTSAALATGGVRTFL